MKRFIALIWAASALAQTQPTAGMPRLIQHGTQHILEVDGHPSLILGAQVNNSSGWPETLQHVWPTLHALNVNTAEIPVYWENVEPEENHFHFDTVDAILRQAREHHLHLVLLWFGTWKNGAMDYAPDWVKLNPSRFPHMLNRVGEPIGVLSPHSQTNLNADRAAFTALMRHLKEADTETHTVILVQVENESGSLGSVRDFSPAANKLFAQQVPVALTKALNKSSGTWSAVFGVDADESFAAYSVAHYVNEVAASGKREYPLPLYVNNWLRDRNTFLRPGEGYPSGGPTSNMLSIWKATTPSVDIVAPDIYLADYPTYQSVCSQYKRVDNPLLIPETGASLAFARDMFYAIGDYSALGVAPFGADHMGVGENLNPAAQPVAANFRLFSRVSSQIPLWQAEGKIHSLVEEEFVSQRLVRFSQYQVLALFGEIHFGIGGLSTTGTVDKTGRVLVAESAPEEFYILGFDARVQFAPVPGTGKSNAQILSAEEGSFVEGQWRTTRRLNGDETAIGLVFPPSGNVVRVKLTTF